MRPPSSSLDLPGQIPFVAEALARIKGMFEEMPGTEWTVTDAAGYPDWRTPSVEPLSTPCGTQAS